MKLDKLQRISTTVVQPQFRVRWMKWWNSSDISREALHFPPPKFTDATLESWLPRAAFWAEVNLLLHCIVAICPSKLYLNYFANCSLCASNLKHTFDCFSWVMVVQLEDSVAAEVINALHTDDIQIDWEARLDLDEINQYVEK
jgi:hypothetical protein